jgi:oligopeptidase A
VTPVAYLVTNFAPPVGDGPAYITHNDMVTLFHEMGHCLHHLLGEVDLPSVGGIAGWNGMRWNCPASSLRTSHGNRPL